jgi:HTH-type transcriptional regulator/antitoxin HigA
MAQNTTGLSHDFIIHPGETLAEVLEDKGMKQNELASRTGMTPKHISTIVNCEKPISTSFAKKLEYVLGIDSGFWINLQANYDKALSDFQEINKIDREELHILRFLKKQVVPYLCTLGRLNQNDDDATMILNLRKLLRVSNLTLIKGIAYNAAYRAQLSTDINVYVLFAWQRICELLTNDIVVANELSIEKLIVKTPEIKALMFQGQNEMRDHLIKIFADCGIAFQIVPNFKGAPVQGFIKKSEKNRIILCMTIRQKFADRFWFTLFHEVAHLVNGDVKQPFIDFDSIENEAENLADSYAKDQLLDPEKYFEFVNKHDFSLNSIRIFAEKENVRPFIVIGRSRKIHYGVIYL